MSIFSFFYVILPTFDVFQVFLWGIKKVFNCIDFWTKTKHWYWLTDSCTIKSPLYLLEWNRILLLSRDLLWPFPHFSVVKCVLFAIQNFEDARGTKNVSDIRRKKMGRVASIWRHCHGVFSIMSRTRLDCPIHMVYLQCRMILFETVNHFESHEQILGRRNIILHFGNESKKYKEKNVAKKTHFLEQS